ncbi:MAG: hypothetical protein WBO55_05285 [Rhizobiaceae bacterium]
MALQNKFFRLFDELAAVENKVHAQVSGVLGRKHAFSKAELVSNLNRLQSWIKKIADDVNNWAKRKKLGKMEWHVYKSNRDRFSKRYNSIHRIIISRKDTFLESLTKFFLELDRLIKAALPTAGRVLKMVMHELTPPAGQKLIAYLGNQTSGLRH